MLIYLDLLKSSVVSLLSYFAGLTLYRNKEMTLTEANRKISQIPLTVWILGIMTLLLNLSSIMIFSLSPLYLTQVMGLAAMYLGIFEGCVEFCSWVTRVFAGALSDYLRKRKPILISACIVTVIARPLFAIAPSVTWVYGAKLLDRISNGFQATPREALVGDVAPSEIKGTCYGLRQSLGVTGSLLGAAALMYLMRVTHNDYKLIFWIAGIPPILALCALLLFVKDSPSEVIEKKLKEKERGSYFKALFSKVPQLSRGYWTVICVTAIFMISNYSGAYRILQAKNEGFPIEDISIIMIAQNLGTMLAAFPMGRFSDMIDRRILLTVGFFITVSSNLFLVFLGGVSGILVGSLLWGMQMGVTQSILSTMVADTTNKALRGTAFGIYYCVIAFSLLCGNTLMGCLSGRFGLSMGFVSSAIISAIGIALVFLVMKPFRNGKETSAIAK
jgi:MFS family permease